MVFVEFVKKVRIEEEFEGVCRKVYPISIVACVGKL